MNEKNKTNLLDHGYVKLLNLSGPVRRVFKENTEAGQQYAEGLLSYDCFIDQDEVREFDADDIDPALTARISFDNFEQERARELDLKLVAYLIKNHHNTPVEMIEIWMEMKLPIFLARQFVRHRTACINEVSARYSVLPAEWYIPEVVGGKPTNGMKQGQEDNLSEDIQNWFKFQLGDNCAYSYRLYERALANGIAPEHARMFLHVNHYTNWVWKQDLSNMMHFLALRLDAHAQVEARVYAQAIYDLLSKYLPETMKLFDKHRRLVPQSGKPREVLVKEIANTKFSELSEDELNSIYAILGK